MNEFMIDIIKIWFYIGLNGSLVNNNRDVMSVICIRWLFSMVIFPIWFPLTVIMCLFVGREPMRTNYQRRRQIIRGIFEIPSTYRTSLEGLMEEIGKLVIFIWAKTRSKFSKKERLEREWHELFYCGE